jgi:hypothetical protein
MVENRSMVPTDYIISQLFMLVAIVICAGICLLSAQAQTPIEYGSVYMVNGQPQV